METGDGRAGDVTPLPRPVTVVAALVLVVGVVMAFLGAWQTGLSWDEPYHVQRLENFFEDGWYLIDADLIDGRPHDEVEGRYVYGPVAALLAHGANVLLGNEAPGAVASTPAAIGVRHLTMALLGVVGAGACACMTRLVIGSWRWAMVAAALLTSMPGWLGHTMFNIKDVPVATGYSLVTLGAMLLVRGVVARTASRRRLLIMGAAAVWCGTLLAAGTRPGIWPGLAAAGGVAVLSLLLRRRPRDAGCLAACLLGLGAAAWACLAAVHPAGFAHLRWVVGAVSSSNSFAGRRSPFYVPQAVLVEVPTITLLLVLVTACLWLLARDGRRARSEDPTNIVLASAQLLLIPTLATAGGSTFYDGLRQILFGYPALAVLITVMVARTVALLADPAAATRRRLIFGTTLVALALPTLVQSRLFPFNYAFSSELGTAAGMSSRGDYWRTSMRALAPKIPPGEHLTCTPVLGADDAYRRYSPLAYPMAVRGNDCRTDPISPVAPYLPNDQTGEPAVESFVEVSTEPVGNPRNCTVLAEVRRTPYFSSQRISELSRCHLSLPQYPEGGVTFGTDPQQETAYLLGEWTASQVRPGVSVLGDAGSVGFALDASAEHSGLVLTYKAESDARVDTTVNDVPVTPARVGRDTWQAPVPESAATALGDDRLVVSWTPDKPGWTLLSVSVSVSDRDSIP